MQWNFLFCIVWLHYKKHEEVGFVPAHLSYSIFSILLLFYKKESVILCHNQRPCATCRRLFVGSQIQLCVCRKTEISTYSVYSLFSHTFVYFCSVAVLLHKPNLWNTFNLKIHAHHLLCCFLQSLVIKKYIKMNCTISQLVLHQPGFPTWPCIILHSFALTCRCTAMQPD